MSPLKKILIVDDEPNNRILLEDILTDFTGDSAPNCFMPPTAFKLWPSSGRNGRTWYFLI
ncbi:MAG: hypothetical protein RBT41_09430 [Clostridia bacterium]|jgi:CheY-like chemotaxis protein|nr:hypothetical protein [Clostridia bacterium]